MSRLVAWMAPLLVPISAHAGVTFNGICVNGGSTTQAACSSSLSGTAGNSVTLNAQNDATLKVKISAWQANQSTGAITSAYLGAYTGGFGVTGSGDMGWSNYQWVAGGGGQHQIDNTGGYTDFVLLQFNSAVHIDGGTLNLYGLDGYADDSDASVWNGSALTPSTWNGAVALSSMPTTNWSTTLGNSNSGYRDLSSTGFSQVWLVSASVLSTSRDDGFKLAGLAVTRQIPAVPEPATWAMMILGFGMVGASLRRRAAATSTAIA
ncbi:PEPxxWA-CTERM sorting domain-containing protein [Sphingomonas sp.]|uniref:PEPxxWA-CTERM sorting domain-containing protein n=1 Tax=Sphingomonas sp. TaxID=28214 RepID=UPI0025D216BD|nr:PEPxxWA-CTERM sorting domain-containing protein [Sphingomonas sp.]